MKLSRKNSLVPYSFAAFCIVIGIAVYKGLQDQKNKKAKEGFVYAGNPCGGFTSCASCADAAGCGWCSDSGLCIPMAQDGFPLRRPSDELPACSFENQNSSAKEREYCKQITQEISDQRPLCNPFGFVIRPEACPVAQ